MVQYRWLCPAGCRRQYIICDRQFFVCPPERDVRFHDLEEMPEGTPSFDDIFNILQAVTDDIEEDAGMYTLDPDSKLFF